MSRLRIADSGEAVMLTAAVAQIAPLMRTKRAKKTALRMRKADIGERCGRADVEKKTES